MRKLTARRMKGRRMAFIGQTKQHLSETCYMIVALGLRKQKATNSIMKAKYKPESK